MVTDDAALKATCAGPDGLLAGLEPGKVYVDMSTVSPQASRRLAECVSARGAQMLDARLSGSVPQAESGTLAIFVSGNDDAFATVEPLLRELGQAGTHVSSNGQGLVLKLAINISLAVQTLAFSEGLLLAERGGIDPRVAAEVMSTSSIGSPDAQSEDSSAPSPARGRVVRRRADAKGYPAGTPDRVRPRDPPSLLTRARNLGYAHRDLAALHEVLAESHAGCDRPSKEEPGDCGQPGYEASELAPQP
jgi:NAD binding domain of 6-phosphogluconate dehydrogenase/NAD-binding of NADP-dependent 3-hydroxyisobutyrate dehydrogenase